MPQGIWRACVWRAQRTGRSLGSSPVLQSSEQNLNYADRQGNIGWIAAGEAPVRPNHNGLLPVPGESGKYDWTGYLTVEQHPQLYNPPQGWIATANHDILPPGYPYVLGFQFAAPYRFQRIAEVLGTEPKHSVEDSRQLQLDVTSVPARRFRATVAAARPKLTGNAATMAAELAKWDGVLRMDSVATTMYEYWQDAAETLAFDVRPRPALEVLLNTLEHGSDPTVLLQQAGDQAWARLAAQYGPDSSKWAWGSIHELSLKSAVNSSEWSLAPTGRPGDGNTPNATSGVLPAQTSGASFREVLDLADWDRSISTNVPGESGDPASPHYSDLLGPWSRGEYHPLAFSRKAVEKVAGERFTLR